MSVQWGKTPYYYPIQIAQFALQHYSKNLSHSTPPEELRLGDEEDDWQLPKLVQAASIHRKHHSLLLNTDGSPRVPGATLTLSDEQQRRRLPELKLDAKLGPDAALSLHLRRTDTNQVFTLHYLQTPEACIGRPIGATAFVHGIGKTHGRRTILRNLPIDLSKVLGQPIGKKKKKVKVPSDAVVLEKLELRGEWELFELKLLSTAHGEHFLTGADWFLASQEAESGGWAVPVRRSLAGDRLVLPPGWHSAMGQGHAMSLLSRAFLVSKEQRYLAAAERAVRLFSRPASEGGVVNRVLGRVEWFEEYPTQPGSFVLNGFLYSLLGLADLAAVSPDSAAGSDCGRGWRRCRCCCHSSTAAAAPSTTSATSRSPVFRRIERAATTTHFTSISSSGFTTSFDGDPRRRRLRPCSKRRLNAGSDTRLASEQNTTEIRVLVVLPFPSLRL